jgi:hypothetical protein
LLIGVGRSGRWFVLLQGHNYPTIATAATSVIA